MTTHATWPYVNDFLHVVHLANATGFDPPAVWMSRPPTTADSTPDALAARRRAKVSRPPNLEPYYRLTPALFARLTVAVDRLAARKSGGTSDPSMIRALAVLRDLRSFIVISGGVTDGELNAVIDAAAAGKLPPVPYPAASRDEIDELDRHSVAPVGSTMKPLCRPVDPRS